MLTKSTNWREEAEAQLRQAYRDNAKRERAESEAWQRDVEEGAARLLAMTEDEKLERLFRADLRRAERLTALAKTPLKFADKERQHQGEFTNESANYDEAREAQDHR